MKVLKYWSPILLLLLFVGDAYGQKRALGYPKVFESPLDPFDQVKYESFIRGENIIDRNLNRAWWVVVDRDNVKAYDLPDGNVFATTLQFGAGYYVIQEQDDWVELIDATVDKREIKKLRARIGWVRKNDLLLWNECLVNPRTKVELKALVLNKFDDFKDIPCDKKELVKIFTSPSGANSKDLLNINNKFYFVYKKEGTRYLIGETIGLSYYNPDFLLGWIDKGKAADWNTRIALEPNFTEEGYNERKNNPAFQVYGFSDAPSAEDFGQGKIGVDKADWSRDPVRPGQEVAKSDPKRFPGGYMRFPLLSVGGQTKKSVLPYFKSAVLDEVLLKVKCVDGKTVSVKPMPIGKHVSIAKELERYQRASKYFNVFFVVEGSKAMSGFKENIISAIDEVKSTIYSNSDKPVIRFGALVYKDVTELKSGASPQTLVKLAKLTADQQSIKDWVRGAAFSNPGGSGEYPVQNYGLYKAIEAAEFPKYETNIIIILGQKGDFAKDRLMRKQHEGKSYYVPNATIEDLIVKNDINVFAVQCIGGTSETDRSFALNLRTIILESAKKHYNNLYLKNNSNPEVKESFAKLNYYPKPPAMDDPDEAKDPLLILENGTIHASIFRAPGISGNITQETFFKLLQSQCATITKTAVMFANEVDKWNYNEIDKNGFNPRLNEVLVELYDDIKLDDSFTDEKYELVKPMYFARQPQGAKYPTFSFVTFWSEGELTKYYTFLEKLLIDVSNLSAGQKRIKLQELYCKLLDEFAGGENGKDCTEYTIEEIIELILGVKGEGLDFESKCIKDKTLKCLVDTKCTTDDEVEQLIYCFTGTKKVLYRMLNNYENEEFVYSRGGEYYFWIKLTDLF
jgi:hypothetical protein